MVIDITKAIRFKNLLLLSFIFFSLELLFHIKAPLSQYSNINLLAYFSVILTAAAGYVINDYFDKDSDILNSKKNKTNLSENRILILYYILTLASILISSLFNNQLFFELVIVAHFALFLYSWKLKNLPLIGNLTIAILSGICPLIMYITHPEIKQFLSTINSFDVLELVIPFIYACLSFFTTFIREIIKDIEDYNGDKALKAKTIPIIFSKEIAKFLAILLLFAVTTFILLIILNHNTINIKIVTLLAIITLIFIPLIITIRNTVLAKEKKDYTVISNLLKFIFASSNVVLLVHIFT
ncbi:MAG: UbiA family prenyltransferase [Flavobacteriales bacterium]|jgi:4-hydroxybenzoate polyprenyltransferase|nr:UbiA family prenyltransferase [Flavobacteriales bacterium]